MDPWIEHLPAAVTVTDAEGRIIAMNAKAAEAFSDDGGTALLGSSVFDCHPEPAKTRTLALYAEKTPNHYTIEKKGLRKIIHQMPYFDAAGAFAGFVEVSVPIPEDLPHFVRT
jgi:transcriptional regulator with PAS, ATPase and Fis domain